MSEKPVKDIKIDDLSTMKNLLENYDIMGGFMARELYLAYEILAEAIADTEVTFFMSFPADIVATGLRGIIRDMIRLGWIDIIVTTCGTWDHDLARTYGKYYIGTFYEDDRKLVDRDIHRLGNIFVPRKDYGVLIEEKMSIILNEIWENGVSEISTYELSWEIGKRLGEESILGQAYLRKIPVIIPGPYDGAVGSQIWIFQQTHKDFYINLNRDESLLSDIVFEAKKTAALIIGGGISKHHVLWWNQFRGGLDYAVQITTAIEFDGSLSGARLSEAVSWGKIKKEGKDVSVWGEATILLPILVRAIYEALGS
jgi:deoxyhypusine synthase